MSLAIVPFETKQQFENKTGFNLLDPSTYTNIELSLEGVNINTQESKLFSHVKDAWQVFLKETAAPFGELLLLKVQFWIVADCPSKYRAPPCVDASLC